MDALTLVVQCPIGYDILVDPVQVPCCTRVFSRANLRMHLSSGTNSLCPLCRADLNEFNLETAPTSLLALDIIDHLNNINNINIVPLENQNIPDEFEGKINILKNNNQNIKTQIAQLQISNKNNTNNFKTLVIPVIDASGSMGQTKLIDSAINQALYSLSRIIQLAQINSNILVDVITYSDTAHNQEINNNHSVDYFIKKITEKIENRGTSFKAAFDKIIYVINKYAPKMHEINSIVIIFLTDGEDSNIQKTNRKSLSDSLKINIEAICNKNYTVHTVGFGLHHDADFLNNLRQIGTFEGAYKYANPNDDNDILSSKINSLSDVIMTDVSIPVKIINTNLDIISGSNDKYWINLTKYNHDQEIILIVSINNNLPININCKIDVTDELTNKELLNQYYSKLIDDIGSEIVKLSNMNLKSLDILLHYELLLKRSKAIKSQIIVDDRLEEYISTIDKLKIGEMVDKNKLNDLQFEGKYKTNKIQKISVVGPSMFQPPNNVNFTPDLLSFVYKTWNTYKTMHSRGKLIFKLIKEKDNNDKDITIKTIIECGLTYIASKDDAFLIKWIDCNQSECLNDYDIYGSNVLIVASSIGRNKIVDYLLSLNLLNINLIDKHNFNAIDYAIQYGYWRTFNTLWNYGARPSSDIETLFRTCISKKYYTTASLMLTLKLITINDTMIKNGPSHSTEWLSIKSNKEISIDTAIEKGLVDIVKEKINTITKYSFKNFLDIFTKPTSSHLQIMNLLLSNGKIDPDEEFKIKVKYDNEYEDEITWGLYLACEKGCLDMFKILIKYVSINKLNFKNYKGTSCLWIASCNKYIDIVCELINLNVDINTENINGDTALIPVCQKGNQLIAETLIDAGIDIFKHNPERDNAVLICCRAGQSKILDLLLNKMSLSEFTTIWNTYAEIDGFKPLLAAVELEQTECIETCIKYANKFNINIEYYTDDLNKIIPRGTAVHLACLYGLEKSLLVLNKFKFDMNAQSLDGSTPLHIAIKKGHKNIVNYLINICKVNMRILDNDGLYPEYYAQMNGNEIILKTFFTDDLVQLLKKIFMNENLSMIESCKDQLINNGISLGCYDYEDIININLENGVSILSYALLAKNQPMIDNLQLMGASINIKDVNGITPGVYAYLLNQQLDYSNETLEMCSRINSVKNNIQNKFLTNISNGMPKLNSKSEMLLNSFSIHKLIEKMNDGFNLKIDTNTLNILEESLNSNHSLMGFSEKLRNNKIFSDGEQILDYLFWNMRMHIIKIIAQNELILSPTNIASIYLYTSNPTIFKQVNQTLGSWNKNSVWNPFVQCLYQAINLAPKFTGEVYRAVDTQFDPIGYSIGHEFSWNTFSMCSSEWSSCVQLINNKKGIIFIIKSNEHSTGKHISKYSANPSDKEIIFKPNTKFVITNHYKANVIALGQSNIRTTTFEMEENDYLNVAKGKTCIIVELNEITNNNNILN